MASLLRRVLGWTSGTVEIIYCWPSCCGSCRQDSSINVKLRPNYGRSWKGIYINHVCAPISAMRTYLQYLGLMEDRRKLNRTTPYLGHNLRAVPHISVTNTPYLPVILWQEDILIGMHCTVCADSIVSHAGRPLHLFCRCQHLVLVPDLIQCIYCVCYTGSD